MQEDCVLALQQRWQLFDIKVLNSGIECEAQDNCEIFHKMWDQSWHSNRDEELSNRPEKQQNFRVYENDHFLCKKTVCLRCNNADNFLISKL